MKTSVYDEQSSLNAVRAKQAQAASQAQVPGAGGMQTGALFNAMPMSTLAQGVSQGLGDRQLKGVMSDQQNLVNALQQGKSGLLGAAGAGMGQPGEQLGIDLGALYNSQSIPGKGQGPMMQEGQDVYGAGLDPLATALSGLMKQYQLGG